MLDTIISFPLSILLFLTGYIVLGIGLYRLARAIACPYPLLAWIPFGRLYLLGQVADIYTDNRITPPSVHPHPSNLRRKLLGFGIGYAAVSTVTTVGKGMRLIAKAASVFSSARALIQSLFSGDASLKDVLASAELSPALKRLSIAGNVLQVTGIITSFVLGILILTALCPALYRVFRALTVPIPALMTVACAVSPLLAAILILIYTYRAKNLNDRFTEPVQDVPAPRQA